MSNNKQSSVEWIENAFYKKAKSTGINHDKWEIDEEVLDNFFKQAKEMERVEHMKTWTKAIDQTQERAWNVIRAYDDFDEYYEQTYGGNK